MDTSSTPPASPRCSPLLGSGGCTPHLKRVLKSYQAAAVSSLQGPPPLMADGGPDDEEELAAPPFPIQQPPLLTPPDQARCSERSETQLESYSISCFAVGGERRLCLPQILNTVLADFSLQQINGVCDELHIFCSRCNDDQLDVLKATGVLPSSAPSCGLITKSDAERLCAALIHCGSDGNPASTNSAPVYHECFGGASGTLLPEAYIGPCSACVRCRECGLLFAPRRFVCHAHRGRESRTCHWGFDSANWRHYLLLDDRDQNAFGRDDAEATRLRGLLRQFKDKFTDVAKRKQSPPPSEVRKKKAALAGEEAGSGCTSPYMAVGPDPAQWYPQWARTSAFKPWSPATLKERGKLTPHVLPTTLSTGMPAFTRNSMVYPMVGHVPREIVELQRQGMLKPDPDRPALPLLPTVALSTAAAAEHKEQQQQHLGKRAERITKEEVPACSVPGESLPNTAPAKLGNGRLSADTEETMSNSSLSTLSGVEEVGIPEDCKEIPMPELRGLWGVFEKYMVGDHARQEIMREVNLLIASCQQRHLLGMGLAGYRVLFYQQQESERLQCKLANLSGVADSPAISLHRTPPAKSISPPPQPSSSVASSCNGVDAASSTAAMLSAADTHDCKEVLLGGEMQSPSVEKKLLLAT